MSYAMIRWHKSNLTERMYCNTVDQKKIAMPRYYKDKVYTELERKKIAFFAKISAELRETEFTMKMVKQYGADWYRMIVESDIHSFEKMYKDAEKDRRFL